jgi:hypothetical protein
VPERSILVVVVGETVEVGEVIFQAEQADQA